MCSKMFGCEMFSKNFGMLDVCYTMIEDMAQNAEFWLTIELSEISKKNKF
jgi:hypothetical protein